MKLHKASRYLAKKVLDSAPEVCYIKYRMKRLGVVGSQ